MKKLTTIGIAILIAGSLAAQTCGTPISDMEFQPKYNQVAAQRSDPARLQEAKVFVATRCLLSIQVKQLAALFATDASRLEFVKAAWANTFDKMNFYDVYDAFSTYSAVFRLDNWINETKGTQSTNTNTNRNSSNTALPKYPNIPYPNCNNYRGKSGCSLPIADADFEIMVRPLFAKTTDAERQSSAKQMLQSNCLSMAQLMKLASLIEMESMRLGFMKESFLIVYDLENYNYAAEMLSHVPYKNDWTNYAAAQIAALNGANNNTIVTEVCEVKAEEFQQIKRSVEKEYSAMTKMTVAKQVIAAKKCFTTAQLKEIVASFLSEMDRLSLAKYAYDYCTDKGNYYQMNDVFNSSYNKNELAKYISTKK